VTLIRGVFEDAAAVTRAMHGVEVLLLAEALAGSCDHAGRARVIDTGT
jgi:hypothetical protein